MAMIECPECSKEISSRASECPNCAFPLVRQGKKQKKSGVGLFGIVVISGIVLFIIFINLQSDTTVTNMQSSENSAEYQQQVYDHMKVVLEDPEINDLRVDGSVLYINFTKNQTKKEYLLVARSNAVKFSRFKNEKLGVSGVSVICTHNGQTYAVASARGGVVTEVQ